MLWPRAPCIFSKKSCCGQRSVRVPPQNVGHRHILGAKTHQTLATVRLSTPRMCSFLLLFCKCYETPHFLQYIVKISDASLRFRTANNMTSAKHSFLAWVPRVPFLELIASEARERYPRALSEEHDAASCLATSSQPIPDMPVVRMSACLCSATRSRSAS